MSYLPDRNPSPPPEILECDESLVPDRIGNTIYSKRWLYKTLMNMLKVVQEYPSQTSNVTEETSLEVEKGDSSSPVITELDPQIEEDACTLWDMSANNEVAEFLCQCDIADIFVDIIDHTKSPRLLEIVLGILGNISSFNSTCKYISRNKALVYSIVVLSGCSDSCSLVQLFRLLSCGISKENSQREWLNSFEENPFLMENLKSILVNNLCRDVLRGLLEFLDHILNYSSTYNSMWGEQSYVLSIIECGKQLLKSNYHEDLDTFFSVLNTLCQHSSNILEYAKHFESLRPIFHAYFAKLGEEDYLPQIVRVDAVSSTFALYGNLLFSGSVKAEHVVFDNSVFKAMLNICRMVKSLLVNLKSYKEQDTSKRRSLESVSSLTKVDETNGGDSSDDDTVHSWNVLFEAILHAAKACVQFSNQDSELQLLQEILSLPESAAELVS